MPNNTTPHPAGARTLRRFALLAAGLVLMLATGCHYDYGYYGFGYSYGYDCYPRYHSAYDCDYQYTNIYYHAPCDGVRFRTGYTFGDHPYRRGHCDW